MDLIYIIEDDDNIREMILYALNTTGFNAIGFSNGENIIEEFKKNTPSLILLDIMLPGIDGLSILKKLKKSDIFKSIPIIMLTAKCSEIDKVKGLDLGADDYITKPFSIMEVISRVKAVLRRCNNSIQENNKLIVDNIILDNKKHNVYIDSEEIKLTFKEFELLQYLMCNQGIVISREKLLEQIWGFDYDGQSRTVDMHIKSLRQKLGESGSNIVTVRNVGYKIGV